MTKSKEAAQQTSQTFKPTSGTPNRARREYQVVRIIPIAALATLMLSTGCETQADRDARAKDEANFNLTVTKQARDLNDRLHTAYVEGTRLRLGASAARTLDQCYADGYDSVQNDDHTFRNDPKLGPKYVAKCDKIANFIKAQNDAEERQRHKETSR